MLIPILLIVIPALIINLFVAYVVNDGYFDHYYCVAYVGLAILESLSAMIAYGIVLLSKGLIC